MVESFEFYRTPKIIFGTNKIYELKQEIKYFGTKGLVITGGGSFLQSEKGNEIRKMLQTEALSICYASVSGEPSPGDVDSIVNQHQDKIIDVVISIGGGSVIDTGKAVSAMLFKNEPVKHYLEGVGFKTPDGTKVPFIAIPTTAGTGSEATKNAVISEVGENGFKKSLRHDNYVPDVALIDPELTRECPKHITAASGMDAFSQLLESYLSTKAGIFTDSLIYKGLQCIKSSLIAAFRDGKQNISAREDIAYAALISGIGLANAGLGVVHGFASSLGGTISIPHGIVCGSLMEPANRKTIEKLQKQDPDNIALTKYAELGRMFTGNDHLKTEEAISKFLETLRLFSETLQLPKFRDFGLTEEKIFDIASKTSSKNNPVKLDRDELKDILSSRL